MTLATLDFGFRRKTRGRGTTKPGWVYLVASSRNGTLYLGVTSNLPLRAWQHRTRQIEGFTKKYRCHMLVWFEDFDDIQEARACEYRMKTWKRAWKIALIEKDNPLWRDLYDDLSC